MNVQVRSSDAAVNHSVLWSKGPEPGSMWTHFPIDYQMMYTNKMVCRGDGIGCVKPGCNKRAYKTLIDLGKYRIF